MKNKVFFNFFNWFKRFVLWKYLLKFGYFINKVVISLNGEFFVVAIIYLLTIFMNLYILFI